MNELNELIQKLKKKHPREFSAYEKQLYKKHLNFVSENLDVLLNIESMVSKEKDNE